MRKKLFNRFVSCLILFCMAASYITLFPIEAFASEPDRLVLDDDYLSASINTKNGRFAIKTTGGNLVSKTDDDKPILYEKQIPETSYTSFRINEEEVIFGNTYKDGGNTIGYMVEEPRIEGNEIISVWRYRDVEITQIIELMTDEGVELSGNAKVSYIPRNLSDNTVKIGARIMLDVKAGDNDGPVIMTSRDLFPVGRESVLEGTDVPLFWRAVDNMDAPQIAAYGMLYGWGDARPSKIIIGHWNNLASAKYNYETDKWLDYTVDENLYGTADSAVAIYWDEDFLWKGQSRVFSTYVGMGDLDQKFALGSNFTVNVSAPKRIELEEGNNEPFEVIAEINNSYAGAADQTDIFVDISYPTSCELVEGNKTILIPELKKGEITTVNWKFKADSVDEVNAYSFTALVNSNILNPVIGRAYVVMLPAFNWAPQVQYHVVTPNKMYFGEVDRKITVSGQNLNYLKDNPENWDVYVQDSTGKKTYVNKKYVEVENNYRINLFLPEGLKKDTYGLGIEVLKNDPVLGSGFFRNNAFELNEDISLIKRAYGNLVITEKKRVVFDDFNNRIELTDNILYYAKTNTQVNIPEGEKELFRITGNIQEMERIVDDKIEKYYSIIPSQNQAVYLSKVLKLTSETGDQYRGEVTVELKDIDVPDLYDAKGELYAALPRQAIVNGNDDLRIYLDVEIKDAPAIVPSKPLVWKGKFEFNVNKMEIKNPDVLGLGQDVTAMIGNFTLSVIKLRTVYDEHEKMYAAEFSGSLSLMEVLKYLFKFFGDSSNKYRSKLLYADINVESFRIYEDGTIGFKTEVGVGLPQMKIGSFIANTSLESYVSESQTGGIEGRLKIDTIEDLYSVFFGLTLPDLFTVGTTNHTGGFRAEVGIFTVDTPFGPVPFPDMVEMQYKDNLGIVKIPYIPFMINQVGGGIYNLHTIRDAIDRGEYPDFAGAFWIGVTDTETPIILGRRMFSVQDCKVYASTKYLSLSGIAHFYHIPVQENELRIMYYPAIGAYLLGRISILDIIVGQIKGEISYDYLVNHFYAGGYIRGYIKVPESSPIFPGEYLGDAAANINTEFIQAYGNLPALNVGIGVRYTYIDRLPEIFLYDKNRNKASAYTFADETEDGVKRIVDVGSNLYALKVEPADFTNYETLAVAGDLPYIDFAESNAKEFTSDGKDALIIQAKYPKNENIFPITLTDPSGNNYELITEGENKNVIMSEYKPEEGEPQNYIAIVVPENDNIEGVWTIDTNIKVDFEVFGIIQAPEITNIDAEVQDGKLNIDIELNKEAEEGFEYGIDFYLKSPEEESSEGKEFIMQLAKNNIIEGKIASYSFDLPEELESGDYRVMAGLVQYSIDGVKEPIGYNQKESDIINFVNTNMPSAPTDVTAVAKGNGVVNVKWDAVHEDDVTGYYVYAADKEGNILEGTSPLLIPASEMVFRYEADINDLIPGRQYDIVVQTIKEIYEEEPETDENIIYVEQDKIFVTQQGNQGIYEINWERIEGIDSYCIILDDDNEVVNIPYYDNTTNTTITAIVRNLNPDTLYNASIQGFIKKDLNAKNITVENINSDSKKISWGEVEYDNIESYIVTVSSENEIPLSFELSDGNYTYDEETKRCSVELDGFETSKVYEISVMAKEEEKQTPKRYLSALSNPVTIMLNAPKPPEIDIVLMPTDIEGNGAVQVLMGDNHDNNKPYFMTNVKEASIMFISDNTFRSEITLKRPTDTSNTALLHMSGNTWELPLVLGEGINQLTIKSYNENGDFIEKTWLISCKTTLPSLMLNDTVVSGENVIVSGITDTEATVFVNGNEVSVDDEGCFEISINYENQAIFEIQVRAADKHLNENIYDYTIAGGNIQEIDRVTIETSDTVQAGKTIPLKLIAYDSNNNSLEIPDDYVDWTIVNGEENVSITGRKLKALRRGQCVVEAVYKVTDDFSWRDLAVIDITGYEDYNEEIEYAYLTGITCSAGLLSPSFTSIVTDYNLEVPYNLSSMWLRAITDFEGASIKINGESVQSGVNSRQLSLSVGYNSFEIVVEGENKETMTYNVTVYRHDRIISDNKSDSKKDAIKNYTLDSKGIIFVNPLLDDKTKIADAELDADVLNKSLSLVKQNSDGKKTVNIHINSVKGCNEYELTLPADIILSDTQNQFNIIAEFGTLTVPSDIIQYDKELKKITLSIEKVDSNEITDESIRNKIGNRPIVRLGLKTDGETVAWNNENSQIKISIPYTPTNSELLNSEHITVWYIDGNGNVVEVPTGRYDKETGMVTFTTSHFSQYAVTFVEKTFEDLGNVSWAKKQIDVLYSKGILKGISETKYNPQTNITRADFLYYFIRTLGLNSKFNDNFSDVSRDAYYYKEIGIAKVLGITGGTGGNKFSPDEYITRQDMMTLTERALRKLNKIKVIGNDINLDKFEDKSHISDYAVDSVAALVKEGLIEGSYGRICPLDNTTRAEAAVYLYRIYNK